jgi:hypothetical protein
MIYIVALASIPICRLVVRQFIASELTMVQLHSGVILIYFISTQLVVSSIWCMSETINVALLFVH